MTETADTTTPTEDLPPRRRVRRLLRGAGIAFGYLALLCLAGWATLAVYFADRSGSPPRHFLAALVAIASAAALIFVRPRRYGLAVFAVIFVAVLGWYFSLKPSNDRDWAVDVSRLPWVDINQNHLTIHNLRCFDYRSDSDFTPRWRDQTFDLDALRSVDFALCFWGSKALAHGILSFGFADGQYLAISIETRKQKTESYSAIEGFFRQYELIYVLADERDALRVRTNCRDEDVYLYRTTIKPDEARPMLLSYAATVNALRDKPQWYNALTTNCVTSVIPHARAGRSSAHLSWRTLLSGYAARQAYDNGILDHRYPFQELEARSRINDASRAAADDADFSAIIRANLPTPAAVAGSGPAIAVATRPAP